MTLTKKTITIMKSKYRRMLNRYMTVQDRFAVYYAEYDEAICKLLNAHTKCNETLSLLKGVAGTEATQATLITKIAQLETKTKELYAKKQDAEAKEAEYVAKIEAAVAVNETMRLLNGSKITADMDSIGDIIADCDKELNRLDAELKTLTFVDGL